MGALIFGAIWAESAWGSYWSWDPKETWALVTWIVYTLYLHVRLIMKRSDRIVALISVVGFVLLEVKYLLSQTKSLGKISLILISSPQTSHRSPLPFPDLP